MKFKSNIEVQAGIKDSAGSSGNAGSILSSTSTGVTWIDNYSDWTSVVKHVVKNNGAAVIPKGSPVYVTGSDGTNMLVGLAGNGSEATSSKTMGIMQTQLGTSGSTQTGYVITEGLLQGLNTAGLTAGDPIWLGPNGTLIYGLANKPYAPAHLVFIGIVTKISAGNGEIFVNVQNGFELDELHDVLLTNPQNNQLLAYNNSNSLWENKPIGTVLGGTSSQYVKGDGSFSTAMNSRIEVNFIATAGQTTFVTPYEVGQVDVYYNGSKLYPNEFTAVNGTDIILATGATLNAQISIVKYVSSLSTTAIRNETTFTTTAGQTTFAVNYSPRQVDVFYNGSKLNISEFTATNGTSVVLGFACAAGESIVIDSYVNQISGASGTANYVSKFTGAASLGNSQIFDNGTYVGINNINPTEVLDVTGAINVSSAIRSSGEIMIRRSGNELRLGSGVGADYSVFYAGGSERMRITSGGNVGIGTGANVNSRLHVDGQDIYLTGATDNRIRFSNYGFTGNSMGAAIGYVYGVANTQEQGNLAFYTNPNYNSTGSLTERMRITQSGNLLLRTQTDSGYQCTMDTTAGNLFYFKLNSGNVQMFMGSNSDFYISTNNSQGVKLAVGATSWSAYSDIRLKNITSNIENALDSVDTLSAVRFTLKSDTTNKPRVGLIAQEVQEVLPEAVDVDDKGMLSVRYTELIPLLVASIKELKAEIEILKNK